MKTERSNQQNGQTPNGFLAKASLGQIVSHSRTSYFTAGSVVCTGGQLAECAYLMLSGRCELHQHFGRNGENGIQTFETGQTFGAVDGLIPPLDCNVVAVEDSVVLAMRTTELADLEANGTNGFSHLNGNGHNTAANGDSEHNTNFFFNAPGNRVISFVFLGDLLPAGVLSERIAGQLRAETGQPVILVEFDRRGGDRAVFHADFDHELDGAATLPRELFRDKAGFYRLRLKLPGLLPDPEVVGELFRKLRRRFRYVLATMTAEQLPGSYLFSGVSHSDAAHFFLRSDTEDLYELDLLLHELRPRLN